MKFCLALAIVSMPHAAKASEIEVTPVQKVVTLLTSMLEKGKKGKHEEEVQFAVYKQFCDDTIAEKKTSLTRADQQIEVLMADIQKFEADADQLTRDIAEIDADLATWGGDIKASTHVRETEEGDYDAAHRDYFESIDAIQRAIVVLKQQAKSQEQSSLAQVARLKSLDLIPVKAKRLIDLYLMQDPDASADSEGLAVAPPDANAYEFQSGHIVELLDQLADKFADEKTSLEKEEMNSRHAFQLLTRDTNAQIGQADVARGEKVRTKASKLQAKAEAEGDLEDAASVRKEDHKYSSDLAASCEQKASDFESRQQIRSEELSAIEKSIALISGNSVAGGAALAQWAKPSKMHRGASLAQLRSFSAGASASPLQVRASQFLRDRAEQFNSRVLSSLAMHVADDPFGKVKKMIKDLVVRLMEQANEEAEHNGWCDGELAANEQTRKEKSVAVEATHAEIDELQSSLASISEDIAALSKALAELDVAVAESTRIRLAEKAKAEETQRDAEEAQQAVANALSVLREFYAKAAESTTGLLQHRRKDEPAIFNAPYTGMGADASGVIGLLEMIEGDCGRLAAETGAMEAAAQKDYDEFMNNSEVDKAKKRKTVEHKSAKKQDTAQALNTKRADLEGTQNELDAALTYYDKLKPSCVDSGTSSEDRVARRKEEIESLQEALRILNGEDIA